MLRRRVIILFVIAVTGFWLVMTALLLRRELFVPYLARESSTNALPTQPQDVWLGLLLNDKANTPIGFINVHSVPGVRDGADGVQTRILGRLRLTMGEYRADLSMTGAMWATLQGTQDFEFVVRTGEHRTAVSGAVKNGQMVGEIDSGGEKLPLTLDADASMMFANAPGMGSMAMPSLELGEEVFVETFDPLSMSKGKARIRYVGDERITLSGAAIDARVFTTELSGITSKAWVDESGEVLRAETPVGFILQRMDAAEAMRSLTGDVTQDQSLLKMAAVKTTGELPRRGAKSMVIEISGLEGGLEIAADDSQAALAPGKFAITPRAPLEDGVPLSGDNLDEALANDSFLQITHPRIVAQAEGIVGDETDAWNKALLIHNWVYESLEKDIVPSLPTALDVLRTMEGDCNEHTMLFTALARAVNIPTRMAIGIVWSEEFQAFYYHAWPEVYVGRWVWTDPTFGQHIADATHIKLINGDLAKWWQVAPFIGRLRVNVIEVQ